MEEDVAVTSRTPEVMSELADAAADRQTANPSAHITAGLMKPTSSRHPSAHSPPLGCPQHAKIHLRLRRLQKCRPSEQSLAAIYQLAHRDSIRHLLLQSLSRPVLAVRGPYPSRTSANHFSVAPPSAPRRSTYGWLTISQPFRRVAQDRRRLASRRWSCFTIADRRAWSRGIIDQVMGSREVRSCNRERSVGRMVLVTRDRRVWRGRRVRMGMCI